MMRCQPSFPAAAAFLLLLLTVVVVDAVDVPAYKHSPNGQVSGIRRIWHKITLGFEGPETSETATPNPFTDYRLDVEFVHHFTTSNKKMMIRGYYAADGNAANTGADSGNVWLAHFSPPETGHWNWTASFLTGNNVVQQNSGGESAGYFDGATGSFFVYSYNPNTTNDDRDFRNHGLLQYVNWHHLQFAGSSKRWFLKGGADSPENLLAYDDFDNTPDYKGYRKSWEPHVQDFVPNNHDPTWMNGKGKGLIGALNYLASKGMNAFSFLTMNINGDDRNVFPYISDDDFLRFDVSKLAQWEVIFEHADKMGLFLHFKTQERENDGLLGNDGLLTLKRRVYYRELVARFSHHLALNWNIGEENNNTDAQRKSFANYFRQLDSAYKHPIVIHTWPSEKQAVYTPLLADTRYEGVSLQSQKHKVFDDTLEWVSSSAFAGRRWIVSNDEQGNAKDGVVPDADDPTHDVVRTSVLWGNLMAGGAGVEYYFGYNYDNSDLTCQDWRSRENMWTQTAYALDFFNKHVPFWVMSYNPDCSNGKVWCLSDTSGTVFVINFQSQIMSSNYELILPLTNKDYSIQWFDPRNGGNLQSGSVTSVKGGASPSQIGTPPPGAGAQDDWVALVRVLSAGDALAASQQQQPGSTGTSDGSTGTTQVDDNDGGMMKTRGGVVSRFVLIDTEQNKGIGPLSDGMTLTLSNLGTTTTDQLSVEARTLPRILGSVEWFWNGELVRTEGAPPYTLGGDNTASGDTTVNYSPFDKLNTPGTHTLKAIPYAEADGSGDAGTALEMTITIEA